MGVMAKKRMKKVSWEKRVVGASSLKFRERSVEKNLAAVRSQFT